MKRFLTISTRGKLIEEPISVVNIVVNNVVIGKLFSFSTSGSSLSIRKIRQELVKN